MREAELLAQLEPLCLADRDRCRRPLAHAVHGQYGGLLERRGVEGAGGVRLVVLGIVDSDGSGYHFMDMETFEEVALGADLLGENVQYLTDGLEIEVVTDGENPISTEFPPWVVLEVTQTDSSSLILPNLIDNGDGGASLNPPALKSMFFGKCEEADVAACIPRLCPEPMAPVSTPIRTSPENFAVRSSATSGRVDYRGTRGMCRRWWHRSGGANFRGRKY